MGARALRGAAICVFAFINLTYADPSCSGATTISKASELSKAFEGCSGTWTGDITIRGFNVPAPTASPTVSGTVTLNPPGVTLSGLRQVESGSIEISNIGVTPRNDRRDPAPQSLPGETPFLGPSISAPDLESVANGLTFSNMNPMHIGNFKNLGSVDGIAFTNVQLSTTKTFSDDLFPALKRIRAINVSNTNIETIGPFTLALLPPVAGDVATVNIDSNPSLSSIDLGFNEDEAEDGFTNAEINVRANSEQLVVNLESTTSAYINVGGLRTFTAPSLAHLVAGQSSSAHVFSNCFFENLDLSTVTDIDSSLDIKDNRELSSLNLQALDKVTTLDISNNPKLSSMTLSDSMKGQVNLAGSPKFNCGSVNLPSKRFKCDTTAASAIPTTSPVSSNPSGSGGLSTGAKAGIGVGAAIGALLLIGVVIFFCCRRRRNKSYSTREISSEPYSKSQHSYTESGEMAYSKVPFNPAGEAGGVSEPHSEEHTPTSALAHDWSPPEREVPSAQDRVELEEQQGMRHEMDARSLPDMDSEEDEEADTRSLEDIERIHRER